MDIPIELLESEEAKPSPQLVRAVQEHGIIVPLIVSPLSGGRYRVVDGRRRLAAAVKAGLEKVPAILLSEGDVAAATIFLHSTRGENPVAELKAMQALVRAGLSEEQIARAGYTTRQRIARLAKLNRLIPELFARTENGELPPSVAFEAASLPPERQYELLALSKITGDAVREVKQVRRESALPALDEYACASAGIEEVFDALDDALIERIRTALPPDRRFDVWRAKLALVQRKRAALHRVHEPQQA